PHISGRGHFRVAIHIGNRAGDRFEPIQALVDTGATYTWVPRDVLDRLGVAARALVRRRSPVPRPARDAARSLRMGVGGVKLVWARGVKARGWAGDQGRDPGGERSRGAGARPG